MSQPAEPLKVPSIHRRSLEEIARSQAAPTQEVRRARALLLAADGASNVEIAHRCGVTPRTIAQWRGRFQDNGLDAVRWSRRGRLQPDEIPSDLVNYLLDGSTEPASRTSGCAGPLAPPCVSQMQRRFPWLLRKVVSDDGGVAVERCPVRVAGLYVSSAQRAVAVSAPRGTLRSVDADEAAAQSGSGMVTLTDGWTGTDLTSLLAEADAADSVLSMGLAHGHRDFLSFLRMVDWRVGQADDVFLLINRHSSHIDHYDVDRWLSHPKRGRFHLHLIPSSVLWHNLVVRWLRQAA